MDYVADGDAADGVHQAVAQGALEVGQLFLDDPIQDDFLKVRLKAAPGQVDQKTAGGKTRPSEPSREGSAGA